MKTSYKMYVEYEKQMQREGLFEVVKQNYSIQSAMYPGSYIHISPSFFIPEVVYVDMDAKAKAFFTDPSFREIIKEKKTYAKQAEVRFHARNYTDLLPERKEFFDLLISQYAGFISQACKKYLRTGGYLLVNNSHGDAGVAHYDAGFELDSVIHARSGRFTLSRKDLEHYFIPKQPIPEDALSYALARNRGIGYQKTASHYVFRKL